MARTLPLFVKINLFPIRDLYQHANAIAQWMLDKGAQKGERALIWGTNKHQM